eukprot:CAMPEP_0170479712 /NCGR_PEP_ID=MMETSP0208-20121228/839_1 /TAXON_ID=197538 /ORGANISM="Strombidium inclinatum, Strain S3" /LENGTH=150 /DNA_ID=CAMNT_0010752155 /DNA_START=1043 /DNA_END=1495 /DNA_ORIENTATION=-
MQSPNVEGKALLVGRELLGSMFVEAALTEALPCEVDGRTDFLGLGRSLLGVYVFCLPRGRDGIGVIHLDHGVNVMFDAVLLRKGVGSPRDWIDASHFLELFQLKSLVVVRFGESRYDGVLLGKLDMVVSVLRAVGSRRERGLLLHDSDDI